MEETPPVDSEEAHSGPITVTSTHQSARAARSRISARSTKPPLDEHHTDGVETAALRPPPKNRRSRPLRRHTPRGEVLTLSFDAIWQNLAEGMADELAFDATITAQHYVSERALRDEIDVLPEISMTWPSDQAVVSDLELMGDLGEGGMGRVELAHQRSLHREVAVKRIKPERLSPKTLAALLQEARVTGALEHPNIIPVHALGRDAVGRPLMVMKRVEGVPWRQLIREPDHPNWHKINEPPLVWHAKVLMQVSNAVHFAHSRNIAHRDIKPENIMIGGYGEVYLMDWGVALELNQDDEPEYGVLRGTPAYMAPEMVRGDSRLISARTDVYQLGACLYEVLTGHPPHEGDTLQAVLRHAWDGREPQWPDDVATDWANIARKAMASEPTARHQDALAFQQALAEALRHGEAVRLSEAAQRELAALRATLAVSPSHTGALDSVHIHDLFSACRFGFQQALEIWPNHPASTNGLREATLIMARHELNRARLGTAEALIKDLKDPPAEIVDLVVNAREMRQRERQSIERLRTMEHERDLNVSSQPRSRYILFTGAVWTMVLLAFIISEGIGLYQFDHIGHLAFLGGLELFLGLSLLVRREALLSNSINRQLMASFLSGVGCAIVTGVLVWMTGAPVGTALIMDFMLAFVCGLMLSLTVEKRLFPVALSFLVAAVLGAALPGAVLEIAAIVAFLSHGLIVMVWLGLQEDEAA